jgi:hypothetical protein
MNATELTTELRISRRTLAKWLKAGLPYTPTPRGRQFDPETVISWLVKQGLVAKPPQIVPTAAAAATELGISERAFHTWLAAGCPARVPSGGYDLDAARRWNLDRRQPDPLLAGAVSPMLERYRAARAGLAELELARAEGDVFSRAEVEAVNGPFADSIRHACERIQRDNLAGVQAVEQIREALDEGLEQLRIRLGVIIPPTAEPVGAPSEPSTEREMTCPKT